MRLIAFYILFGCFLFQTYSLVKLKSMTNDFIKIGILTTKLTIYENIKCDSIDFDQIDSLIELELQDYNVKINN